MARTKLIAKMQINIIFIRQIWFNKLEKKPVVFSGVFPTQVSFLPLLSAPVVLPKVLAKNAFD